MNFLWCLGNYRTACPRANQVKRLGRCSGSCPSNLNLAFQNHLNYTVFRLILINETIRMRVYTFSKRKSRIRIQILYKLITSNYQASKHRITKVTDFTLIVSLRSGDNELQSHSNISAEVIANLTFYPSSLKLFHFPLRVK